MDQGDKGKKERDGGRREEREEEKKERKKVLEGHSRVFETKFRFYVF